MSLFMHAEEKHEQIHTARKKQADRQTENIQLEKTYH